MCNTALFAGKGASHAGRCTSACHGVAAPPPQPAQAPRGCKLPIALIPLEVMHACCANLLSIGMMTTLSLPDAILAAASILKCCDACNAVMPVMQCRLLHPSIFDAPQNMLLHLKLSVYFTGYYTVQDLSRPSASSAASLARMIGGLALAGMTANIADHPPSPKPSRMAATQRPVFSANAQPGSDCGIAASAPDLPPAHGSHEGVDCANGNKSKHEGSGSEAQSQAAASPAGQSSGARQSPVRHSNIDRDTERPASARGQSQPAAPGQSEAAPASGVSEVSRGGSGSASSTAADSKAGPSPSKSAGNPVVSGQNSLSLNAGNAAPAAAVLTGVETGGTASSVGGGVASGGLASPASIAAYRPGLQAATPGAGAEVGVGVRGPGEVVRTDGYDATRASPVGSSRCAAVLGSDQLGDGNHDAARRADSPGLPQQVRNNAPCAQCVSPSASALLASLCLYAALPSVEHVCHSRLECMCLFFGQLQVSSCCALDMHEQLRK